MLIISLKEIPHDKQHDYAHNMLREVLKHFGIQYGDDSNLTYNEHGKPSLADFPDVHYNLSHADGITACFAGRYECGVDAEKVRQYRPNVVKRSFSESEQNLIESAPEDERDLIFFRIWTLKESYVKAIGIGVSYPLNTIEFSFDGNKIISNIQDYRFKQYIIDEKFVVAICKKDS